jgi:hypothetical protein
VPSRAGAFPVAELDELTARYDAGFDALERDDLDGFTKIAHGLLHPDCRFRSGIGSAVGGGEYRGPEGMSSWFGDLIATTSERSWRNRRYETYDDRILLFSAEIEFTGAGSGARVSGETGGVFEYEEGLCVRVTSFMSIEEARSFAEAHVA